MKKEGGKVVETSGDIDLVKPLATKEFQKYPRSPKRGGPKHFLIFKVLRLQNFEKEKSFLWHGTSVDVDRDDFIS